MIEKKNQLVGLEKRKVKTYNAAVEKNPRFSPRLTNSLHSWQHNRGEDLDEYRKGENVHGQCQ